MPSIISCVAPSMSAVISTGITTSSRRYKFRSGAPNPRVRRPDTKPFFAGAAWPAPAGAGRDQWGLAVKPEHEHVVWILSQDGAGAVRASGNAEGRFVEARQSVRDLEADIAYVQAHRDGRAIDVWSAQVATVEGELAEARSKLWSMEDPGVPRTPRRSNSTGARTCIAWGARTRRQTATRCAGWSGP
jgi:hypothetical protein